MMLKTALCVFFFSCLSYSSVWLNVSLQADDILGTWMTGEGKGKVKIEKAGNKYYGKLVWLREPTYPDGQPKVDKNNPNASQRTTPLLGLQILKDFNFDSGEWEDGTIYDPNNGKTYSCMITMPDKNTLHVRGYIGISLIGRTQVWKRM